VLDFYINLDSRVGNGHDYHLTEHFIYLHKQKIFSIICCLFYKLLPFGPKVLASQKTNKCTVFFISQREVRKIIITTIFSNRKNEDRKNDGPIPCAAVYILNVICVKLYASITCIFSKS